MSLNIVGSKKLSYGKLCNKIKITFVLLIIFSMTVATQLPYVEALKAPGTFNTETNSKKVCGDRLCSESVASNDPTYISPEFIQACNENGGTLKETYLNPEENPKYCDFPDKACVYYHYLEGKCMNVFEDTTEETSLGSDRDEFGCIPSAGYSWSEEKQECVRPWEETMEDEITPLGSDRDEFGCIPSAGYSWSEKEQQCLRPWENPEAFENQHENPEEDSSDDADYLFVLTASSGTFVQKDGRNILTLSAVSEQTIWFTDRPNRGSGHLSTDLFVALWGEGEDSFELDPPNAALDILDGTEDSDVIILELENPVFNPESQSLQFDVIILESATDGLSHYEKYADATIPNTFEQVALFIDNAGADSGKLYHLTCPPGIPLVDGYCKYTPSDCGTDAHDHIFYEYGRCVNLDATISTNCPDGSYASWSFGDGWVCIGEQRSCPPPFADNGFSCTIEPKNSCQSDFTLTGLSGLTAACSTPVQCPDNTIYELLNDDCYSASTGRTCDGAGWAHTGVECRFQKDCYGWDNSITEYDCSASVLRFDGWTCPQLQGKQTKDIGGVCYAHLDTPSGTAREDVGAWYKPDNKACPQGTAWNDDWSSCRGQTVCPTGGTVSRTPGVCWSSVQQQCPPGSQLNWLKICERSWDCNVGTKGTFNLLLPPDPFDLGTVTMMATTGSLKLANIMSEGGFDSIKGSLATTAAGLAFTILPLPACIEKGTSSCSEGEPLTDFFGVTYCTTSRCPADTNYVSMGIDPNTGVNVKLPYDDRYCKGSAINILE